MLCVERRGRGPDLVLLHGWGLHGGVWEGLAGVLAGRFRLHLMDLPGHGASPPLDPCTLTALAAAVAEAMPPRAHVCGWSLGGQVALRLALDFPGRVNRLVLIATTPCFRRRPDWPHGMDDTTLEGFAQSLKTDHAGTLRRFLSLTARSGEEARQVVAELRKRLFSRGEPTPSVLEAGLAILSGTDLRGEVGRIAAPALVLHGSHDTLIPPGAGRWLAENIPGAGWSPVAGAAHAPFLSHRSEVAARMEAFLDG